jgi:hypothetical protein
MTEGFDPRHPSLQFKEIGDRDGQDSGQLG